MTVALGASAYQVAVFHLMTHAFFKALLFLGAGSVIIGMHHDQDMRNMGGLRKYMPITWITSLVGSLALIGTPFFSGFYSKDSIIDAVGLSHLPGAGFAYFAVVASVFVTALYSFRMYFLVFHGEERFRHPQDFGNGHGAEASAHAAHDDGHGHDAHDDHGHGHEPHETPWVVTLPLVLLAIPSLVIGWITIEPMLYGGWFDGAIAKSGTMEKLHEEFHGPAAMIAHAFTGLPIYLALGGLAVAFFLYILRPDLPGVIRERLSPLVSILENKYYFDDFNDWFFAGGLRKLGTGLWAWGDKTIIDGIMVNGTARLIGWFAGRARRLQTGFIYHYAFGMIFGVVALLSFFWLYLSRV
jgi:NADH-quinone oxidoreductase subunit L